MADLFAIDTHVHPNDPIFSSDHPAAQQRRAVMDQYFRRDSKGISIDEMADSYRGRRMMAVLLVSDDETTSGIPPVDNQVLSDAVKKHPDVFFGFGGVDPHKGIVAVEEAKRIKDLGLYGLKFNPGRQHFFPNDPMCYKL